MNCKTSVKKLHSIVFGSGVAGIGLSPNDWSTTMQKLETADDKFYQHLEETGAVDFSDRKSKIYNFSGKIFTSDFLFQKFHNLIFDNNRINMPLLSEKMADSLEYFVKNAENYLTNEKRKEFLDKFQSIIDEVSRVGQEQQVRQLGTVLSDAFFDMSSEIHLLDKENREDESGSTPCSNMLNVIYEATIKSYEKDDFMLGQLNSSKRTGLKLSEMFSRLYRKLDIT